MVPWIVIDVVMFLSVLFFKFNQYKNVNNVDFVYHGKTQTCAD